jgi:hypothetical protein
MPEKNWRTEFDRQLWEELVELQETLDDAIVKRNWTEIRRAADAVERIIKAVERQPEGVPYMR